MSLVDTETNKYASISKPWLAYYSKEYSEMSIDKCTMFDMVKSGCEMMNKKNDFAISYFGRKLTYSEMFERIEEYAAAFSRCGVKKGEIVSFLTVSIPESIFSIYALNKLGAVCNFIDVRTDVTHIKEYIRKAGSGVLITLEMCFEKIKDSMEELDLRLVICQKPSDSLPAVKRVLYNLKNNKNRVPYDGKRIITNCEFVRLGENTNLPSVEYEPDMPAIITRTGGTTGLSKGVVLTNDNLNAIAFNFRASCMEKVPRKRSLLNFLPLGTSYGIAVGVHMALCMCCEDILIPNFDLEKFDDLILKYKPNHIIAVPTFYQKLISSPHLKNRDLSFIHTMAAGGDSANAGLEERLEEFRLNHGIPFPVSQGYGLSEASSAVAFGFQNIHKNGSSGIPSLSVVIAAFKPGTTEELPLGEKGELCISGPTVMKEYLNEPKETGAVLWNHPDGTKWIHSGDLGYVDQDGFVFVIGRIKRSIIRFDGHKVYPLQLEQLVLKDSRVRNCVTIPVKDLSHDQGELPLVIVELNDKSGDKESIKEDLKELCSSGIELRSQPIDFIFIDKIPLTTMAKNDYKKLEVIYGAYDYLKDKVSE